MENTPLDPSDLGQRLHEIFRELEDFWSGFTAAHSVMLAPEVLLASAFQRAVNVSEGFKLLHRERLLLSLVPLTRFQLDNVIRSWGVLRLTDDPFLAAHEVINGKPVRQLTLGSEPGIGTSKRKLTDAFLIDEFAKLNPWVKDAYEQQNQWVRFSSLHVDDFLLRATVVPGTTQRDFSVGVGEVSDEDLGSWANVLLSLTRALLTLTRMWGNEWRQQCGSEAELNEKYKVERLSG